MAAVWFALIALMLAVYVVLDGFDFGVGMLHLLVARNDDERRTTMGAIGPVWDGNEVWLLASGGTLVYAFPRVYSAGFSGFYLPLMMALWLLVLRGISIEFRSHGPHALWRSFWDGVFWFSSTLMAVILGAALGNVIRGVPLDQTGFFHGPLFTDFQIGVYPGVLDWYTLLVGLFATSALALHGACYLILKTEGPVQERSRSVAPVLWGVMLALGVLVTIATQQVRPEIFAHLTARPWTWILALAVAVTLVLIPIALRRRQEAVSFLASAGFLASLLAATAAGMFPTMLISTLERRFDLTAYNSAAGRIGLQVGLIWWSLALLLAIGYFTYLFRSFRGKVAPHAGVYEH